MDTVRVPEAVAGAGCDPGRIWYASYGSNAQWERLACYVRGGRPAGAARTYPGCRDRRMPAESVAVGLAGEMYLATRSPVWGGGCAFYDPGAEGRVLARAHLVTAGQFADIAAQEMYRTPGADLDLAEVLASGRSVLGDGRYETLVCAGWLDGAPVLTLTAPWGVRDVAWTVPSAAYVRCVGTGLLAAGAWDAGTVAAYVAGRPGAAGHWSPEGVRALIAGPGEGDAGPGAP
ncbi:histone deacetylase [Streptomyces benahoarensis]|uniref:Histone deacetylase n=1 Tax=Streptomyces benahoarensis TaxID=2595054 RepID=A0A553ZA36_9ACTN|nr:histone deacetylase [Streptomyces benahoarensis]TSB21410.1 histone deacetylase [Streptomyces benahoarensis]TSB38299.1 histone deacetylase [Streptomyces benahoarensis]